MPVLTNGETVQVRAWTVNAEQAAVNTFYYDISGVVGSPTVLDLITELDTAIAVLYKGIIGADSQYRGLQGLPMFTLPRPREDVVTANAGAGTATGITMPRQACGITSWQTNLSGPRFRGRTFWPFPTVGEDAAGGVPSAGYLASIEALSSGLANFLGFSVLGNTANTTLSVLSRIIPVTTTEILRWVKPPKFATMKKRGSYGRANSSPI